MDLSNRTEVVLDAAAIDTNLVAQIFHDAYMEASIESDEVRIEDAYRTFISFDGKHRFLRFWIVIRCREGVTPEQQMRYADYGNNTYMMVRLSVLQDAISYDYYLDIEGGVTKRNIVLSFKRFMSCAQAAMGDKANDVL